jgi:hypothetical protein
MSLVLEFAPDFVDTFAHLDEFGKLREFIISEGGAEKQFITKCVWDEEVLKTRMIVQQQGVYLGSVLLFILQSCFVVEPKPEQILRTRKVDQVTGLGMGIFEGWRVLDITDAEEVYELYLDKLVA